ncbi:calcium-binding protein [Hoeflea sp. TYP-13]|uniref:calcium-binding protein n=1 Tax=Hoeflea sp. TYP-13 TaxID=3230023 RepID=UPI0034C6DDA8
MKTTQKVAVSLLATTFLGASLVPSMAQSQAPDSKPVAEKRMAHSGQGKHNKRGNRGMKRAFERYDTNKDGVITQEEVDAVIVERFNNIAGEDGVITLEDYRTAWLDRSNGRMVRAFQQLDRDGDGSVTTEEFNAASDRMFNRLDRDGNGELTKPARGEKAEAGKGKGKMAKRSGPRHGGRGAERLMERFDVDKDGKITRAEFDEVRTSLFSGADADGNQSVTLEEFVTVWQDMNSDRVVRGFQKLDADGNLQVTQEEYSARTSDFVKKHDRNRDGVVTKADKKRGKHHGKRSERKMHRHGDRADAKKPLQPVQPIQPDQKG